MFWQNQKYDFCCQMWQKITVKEQICSTGNCQSCQTAQVSSKPPQAASVSKQYCFPFLSRQSLQKSDCACPAGHMELIHDNSTCWLWFWDRSKLEACACARSLYRQKPTILKFEHVQTFEQAWASSGTCTHTHTAKGNLHTKQTQQQLSTSQNTTCGNRESPTLPQVYSQSFAQPGERHPHWHEFEQIVFGLNIENAGSLRLPA